MIIGFVWASLIFLLLFLILSIFEEFLIEKKHFKISRRIALFSLEAGPTLGLLGTLLAFVSKKEILAGALKEGNMENIIGIFLTAWNTSIVGIVIALISLIFLHLIDGGTYNESKD